MALHLMNIPHMATTGGTGAATGLFSFWLHPCHCSRGLDNLQQANPCHRGQQDPCPHDCSVGAPKSSQGGGGSPLPQQGAASGWLRKDWSSPRLLHHKEHRLTKALGWGHVLQPSPLQPQGCGTSQQSAGRET